MRSKSVSTHLSVYLSLYLSTNLSLWIDFDFHSHVLGLQRGVHARHVSSLPSARDIRRGRTRESFASQKETERPRTGGLRRKCKRKLSLQKSSRQDWKQSEASEQDKMRKREKEDEEEGEESDRREPSTKRNQILSFFISAPWEISKACENSFLPLTVSACRAVPMVYM